MSEVNSKNRRRKVKNLRENRAEKKKKNHLVSLDLCLELEYLSSGQKRKMNTACRGEHMALQRVGVSKLKIWGQLSCHLSKWCLNTS